MADRFFTETPPPTTGEIVLTGPDAHHLTAVRRFEPGDRVTLFCGDGNEYAAQVVAVGKKAVTLAVLGAAAVDREPAAAVVVAAALPKGDRADYLVEKLVEVGATRFVPLVTTRGVVVPKDRTVEKLERAVIEASKQCGRNRLMAVGSPLAAPLLWGSPGLPPAKFLLHTAEATPAARVPRDQLAGGVAFAVGPEGGFTPDEVAAATAAGWQPLGFGPRVLRVETAAVVAASWATGLLATAG
jgi:16S rRNA (uracil1498-N3)-methyltransferase